jgi:hypothetical protein
LIQFVENYIARKDATVRRTNLSRETQPTPDGRHLERRTTRPPAGTLRQRGINYDVGIFPYGQNGRSSRTSFDLGVVKREIRTIREDLHCNAIRISGQDIDRLVAASQLALDDGLQVWFSPEYHEATPQQTLSYLAECAEAAAHLRYEQSDEDKKKGKGDWVVFVVGCELSFFMKGLVSGETAQERMGTFMNPWRLIWNSLSRGSFNRRLNTFLVEAAAEVRERFKGPVTYASGMWEDVYWTPFDYVSVDCYRGSYNRRTFRESLQKYLRHGKPVVATEFGCCTYRGAEDKGGYGFAIVDWDAEPPRLNGSFVRDEEGQASFLIEMLQTFEEEEFSGAFAFTFVMPKYPYDGDEPRLDLDMASFAVVKSISGSLMKGGAEQEGTRRYPGMPWEPKRSFDALAQHYYAAATATTGT